MHEAGAPADIELAYTLADGKEYLEAGLKEGLSIDDFAPRFSFFWGIGMNLFMEIAKMRAGRLLWARIVSQYNPTDPKASMLRTHCQTSGYSLVAQDPFNNVSRTCIEALAATLGGTQSLHTNSLDEAIALPSDFSAKIARDTQIYLQNKSGVTDAVDPFGGAYYLESLTETLVEKAWGLIQEVNQYGGMTKAIEAGIPKMRIEEAAAKKQARIDSGAEKVIGVNLFPKQISSDLEVLEVNNKEVRQSQVNRLRELRSSRNNEEVNEVLKRITEAAGSSENLLELSIEAARKRASLGEISMAMENVFGRFKAVHKTISGVYSNSLKMNEQFQKARQLSDRFTESFGRRPRIMIAKLGQDGHDRGAKVIASSFADLGFDVDIGPLFQTPEEAVNQAIENDVHILGISSLAAGHKTLVPSVQKLLKGYNKDDIMLIVGGVIPPKDYDFLFDAGVAAVFGPGTNISLAATEILNLMLDDN